MANFLDEFEKYPEEIRYFYSHFPAIYSASGVGWEAPISYLLVKLEYALLMTLYSGIVNNFGTNPTETWQKIKDAIITRKSYPKQFENIFGTEFKPSLDKFVRKISVTRNELFHGKDPQPPVIKKTIKDVLDFSVAFNEYLNSIAGFKPIGRMQGKVKSGRLAKKEAITPWVMKGLGFTNDWKEYDFLFPSKKD